jgi:5-methylcytosine-specific restriction protein A
MPTLPLSFCRTPGCSVLVRRGFCREHRSQSVAKPDAERWYNSARWRHPVYGMRARVLREQPFCAGPGCTRALVDGNADVDHVIPHRGDPRLFWSRSNLQGLCHRCHAAKTRAGS